MSLRDQAQQYVRTPGNLGAINQILLDAHPDHYSEVVDLLSGEPVLSSAVVARTLSEAFDVKVSGEMVRRWRSRS